MNEFKKDVKKLRENFDLQKINKLPEEIVREITEFIPKSVFVCTNKKNLSEYHHTIKPILLKKNVYESYVRDIIRRDNDFIFYYIVKENYERWKSIKNYMDEYTVYPNYVVFLMNLCFIVNSDKCRQVLHNYIVENQKN
jgi:hypothetical protein